MEIYEKKYKIEDIEKEKSNIKKFCRSLTGDDEKKSEKYFLRLSSVSQYLFIRECLQIISKKTNYSDKTYLAAFRFFKMFRLESLKNLPVFVNYVNKQSLEVYYKRALEWYKINFDPTLKTRKPKDFKKEFQKFETALDNSPLYIYYDSLYKEKKDSKSAITWLTEHGVYEKETRKEIEKKYLKLKEGGKLIK